MAIALAGLMAAGEARAGADIEAGRVKAKPCNTCHGKDGIGTMPMFPNLAGQKALYLEQELKAFRDGTRKSEVMTIVIKDLSDKDIEDLAAYYESLPHAGAGE
ncbi:MAG: c-type cytochrome [Paracoccaceae bacterium]